VTIDEVAPEAREALEIAKMMLRHGYGSEAIRLRTIVRNNKLHDALQRTGRCLK
jgi:hypothetical protein